MAKSPKPKRRTISVNYWIYKDQEERIEKEVLYYASKGEIVDKVEALRRMIDRSPPPK